MIFSLEKLLSLNECELSSLNFKNNKNNIWSICFIIKRQDHKNRFFPIKNKKEHPTRYIFVLQENDTSISQLPQIS